MHLVFYVAMPVVKRALYGVIILPLCVQSWLRCQVLHADGQVVFFQGLLCMSLLIIDSAHNELNFHRP